MSEGQTSVGESGLKTRDAILCTIGAGTAFNLAYTFPACAFLIAVYLWCLFQLTKLSTSRKVSYYGLAAGLLAFAPQLAFFWNIFGPGAIALWCVCAFWIRMFLVVGWSCQRRIGKPWAILLFPFIWTGFEYFRSELYYLRFSWLNAGYVFADNLQWLPMGLLGMYGFGFVIMAGICAAELLGTKAQRVALALALPALAVLNNLPSMKPHLPPEPPRR